MPLNVYNILQIAAGAKPGQRAGSDPDRREEASEQQEAELAGRLLGALGSENEDESKSFHYDPHVVSKYDDTHTPSEKSTPAAARSMPSGTRYVATSTERALLEFTPDPQSSYGEGDTHGGVLRKNERRLTEAEKTIYRNLEDTERIEKGVRNFQESENRMGGQRGFLDTHKHFDPDSRHDFDYSPEGDYGSGEGFSGTPQSPGYPGFTPDNFRDFMDGGGAMRESEDDSDNNITVFTDTIVTDDIPQMGGGAAGAIAGVGTIWRSGTSVSMCDEDEASPADLAYYDPGAPPSLLEEITQLPEDFIFDQRGASEVIPWPGPLFSPTGPFNKNIIIPQQYYYDDYLSESFFFRNHTEQSDLRYNFNAEVGDLKDDFRYVCGASWDHTSVESNMPMTVYHSAVNLDLQQNRVPSLNTEKEARQNRGLLFWKYEDPITTPTIEIDEDDSESNYYLSTLELTSDRKSLMRNLSSANRVSITEEVLSNYLYQFLFSTTAQSTTDPRPNPFIDGIPAALEDPVKITDAGDLIKKVKTSQSITLYSRNYYDHTFIAPVGYSNAFSSFYPPGVRHDEVEIRSHVPIQDMIIEDPLQPYPDINKKSFYRVLRSRYLNLTGAGDLDFELSFAGSASPSEDIRRCAEDKIQKFTPEAVKLMSEMTTYLQEYSPLEASNRSTFVEEFFENFDSYNTISFGMPHTSLVSEWMKIAGLYTMFFEMIDNLYPSNSTFYAQVLDGFLNNSTTDRYAERATANEDFRIDSDLAAVNLRPNEIEWPFMAIRRMLNGSPAQPHTGNYNFEIQNYTYPLGYPAANLATGLFLPEDLRGEDPRDLYFRPLLLNMDQPSAGIIDGTFSFQDAIDIFKKGPHPGPAGIARAKTASQIFDGTPSFSEVLAYRIEKSDAETGEVLQNFFFANTSEVSNLKFLDTQVSPGKQYTYKIFTINFVLGSQYNYELNRASYRAWKAAPTPVETSGEAWKPFYDDTPTDNLFETEDLDSWLKIKMPLSIRNNIRLIEAPYYSQQIRTASSDFPPLFPDVSVAESHRTTTTDLKPTIFILTPQFGLVHEPPLALRSEDEELIQWMITAQESAVPLIPRILDGRRRFNRDTNISNLINYRSDSVPTHYEMFYSLSRPRSYSDLYDKNYLITESSSPYFDLDMPLNTEVFVTFRSRDAGGISNPGPIYEFVKHNYGDGTYISFEILELINSENPITFNRILSIEPSIEQKYINFEELKTTLFYSENHREINNAGGFGVDGENIAGLILTMPEDTDPFATAPPVENDYFLGLSRASDLWNKKFKFRITSTSSGNSFDLNSAFSYSKIIIQPEDSARNSQACDIHEPDADRAQRRAQNRTHSDETLNEVGGSIFNETTSLKLNSEDDPAFSDDQKLRGISEVIEKVGQGQGSEHDRAMDRAEEGLRRYMAQMAGR